MHVSIADIKGDFPAARIAFVRAEGLRISANRDDQLATEIAAVEDRLRRDKGGLLLADVAEIQDWRRAYKAFGVKKTSYRSSVERLLKNSLAGRDLQQINGLVDCYNLVSLTHLVPIGADDAEKLVGGLCFRRSKAGDSFFALGAPEPMNDPPKPGEVVYADAEKVLCRRWNWYQDARSPVTAETSTAILTVQALESADIDRAVAELCDKLPRYCGGKASAVILSAARPGADL